MKKGVEFFWTNECQEVFDELKRRLVSGPILALPKDEGMYVLDTDASDFDLGAVLSQQQPEGEKSDRLRFANTDKRRTKIRDNAKRVARCGKRLETVSSVPLWKTL